MRLTTRRHDVYSGEYTPTGLRMFAWWKKNGERRLQKPSSGSAQNRSRRPALCPFIYRRTYGALRFHAVNFFCTQSRPPPQRSIVSIGYFASRERSCINHACEQVARGAGPLAKKTTMPELFPRARAKGQHLAAPIVSD
jgi:hypothetical protein